MKAPERQTAEAIRAQADKAIREGNDVQRFIYDRLPDSFEKFRIHAHATSYTADFRLGVECDGYSKPQPTAATIRELAAIYPPEPMARYKGTFLSFFPVSMYEAMPQKKQDEYKEEKPITPFIVKLEPASFSQRATVNWFSPLPEGKRLHVEVRFPLWSANRWLGIVNVRYEDDKGGRRVVAQNFSPANAAHNLFNAEEVPTAQLGHADRYSAGSNEHPGDWVIHWEPLDDRNPPTLDDLARAIEAAEKEEAERAADLAKLTTKQ